MAREGLVVAGGEHGSRDLRIGDAYGEFLKSCCVTGKDGTEICEQIEICERSDGLHYAHVPGSIKPLEQRPGCEQRAVTRLIRPPVLDIGCGAGLISGRLQRDGLDPTGLDVSPGALQVARWFGTESLILGTVGEHAVLRGRYPGPGYQHFLLAGGNLGLLSSRKAARDLLAGLAALAAPRATIEAAGVDPYESNDPLDALYIKNNLRSGRLAGERRMRVLFRDMATPWMDLLLCAPRDLRRLLIGSDWRLGDIDRADYPCYVATLHHCG